jgi:hypothetical protein
LLLIGVVLLAAACGGRSGTDDPLQSAIEATASPTAEPTEAPGESPIVVPSEAVQSFEPPPVTQTDTAWGRIWDGLPAGFPVYPGAIESEEAGGGEPVSATFSVADAAPDEIATALQSQLELATFSTEALSGPLEDGGFVIDSVGDAGCRIETTVTPAAEQTRISVRYGAECPFE